MTKKLVWRLERKPEAMEVVQLVGAGIISAEEAKTILFTEKEDEK